VTEAGGGRDPAERTPAGCFAIDETESTARPEAGQAAWLERGGADREAFLGAARRSGLPVPHRRTFAAPILAILFGTFAAALWESSRIGSPAETCSPPADRASSLPFGMDGFPFRTIHRRLRVPPPAPQHQDAKGRTQGSPDRRRRVIPVLLRNAAVRPSAAG